MNHFTVIKLKEKNQNYFNREKSVSLWFWILGSRGGNSEETHFCFQAVWTVLGADALLEGVPGRGAPVGEIPRLLFLLFWNLGGGVEFSSQELPQGPLEPLLWDKGAR